MSRLIFEGDTISRFGKKIPTPFIEKLKIYQDSFECTISIYLHITENPEKNEEIYEDLSNLKLFYGFGQTKPVPVELNLGQDDYFALVDEKIYNSQGQRFAKFVFIRNEAYQQDFQLNRAISDNLMRETYFSCFIAVVEDETGDSNKNLTGLVTDDQTIREFDRRGNYNIYSNVASPLVYEKAFTAPIGANRRAPNRIATDPRIIYEDSTGLPCESIPLQSIQKDYYKTADSFREDLKKQIDELVASYGEVEDQQLQSFLDSISYVSETQNRGVEFIVELDKIRNSFPSRTSTSALGTLYNRLKTIIFSANDALILGEKLQKKIVPNTKIISYLGFVTNDRLSSWNRLNATTYSPRQPDHSKEILYNTFFMERQELEVDKINSRSGQIYDLGVIKEPNYDVVRNFGYFFYDYEKALHFKSNISQIYNVQKLLQIFGNNVLDSFFAFQKTELIRFIGEEQITRILSGFETNKTKTSSDNMTQNPHNARSVIEFKDPALDSERDYVILRKFDTYRGLEGYRLIAFEFQDFQPSSTANAAGQSYRFNVYVEDNTIEFYDSIKKSFQIEIDKLKKYVDYAEDFCSYNNIDGRFNDFFVNKVKEMFANSFPWVRISQHYAFHLHLLEDHFGESKDLMVLFANRFMNYLSPETTTLEVLIEKSNEIIDFYEKYYGDNGSITIELVPLTPASGGGATSSRNLRENTQIVSTNVYDNFPDIYDSTVDRPEPAVLKKWNGTVQDPWTRDTAKEFIISRTLGLMAANMIREEELAPENFYSTSELNMLGALDLFENEIGEFYYNTPNEDDIDGRRTKIRPKQARRANNIFTLILMVCQAIQKFSNAPEEFPYSERKEFIGRVTLGVAEERRRFEVIKRFSQKDKEFVEKYKGIFGNIFLNVIKATRTGQLDCTRVLTDLQGRIGAEYRVKGGATTTTKASRRREDAYEIAREWMASYGVEQDTSFRVGG